MIDRFGLLPPPAKNLFRIAELKQAARALGLRKIDVGPGGGSVTFERDTRVEPATLIRYVQQNSRTHRLEGGTKLRFTLKLETGRAAFRGRRAAARSARQEGTAAEPRQAAQRESDRRAKRPC